MKSASEARSIILHEVGRMPAENVPLLQAHDRVLAGDVVAQQDIPSFDNSSMDGYAVHASDTAHANEKEPVTLRLGGEISAGQVFAGELPRKSVTRIMTGAPLPQGADAVVEQEIVAARNGSVQVGLPVETGRNVRKRGEDILAGATVLSSGTFLRAAHLGTLASLGRPTVSVVRQPSVALLTTGNELVEIDEMPVGGQIRNSNAYSLWGLIHESGAMPVNLGTAKDNETELREKLREGLKKDLLVTSGGVSVGTHDFVMKTLEQLGVELKFWKVNIKPGMPLLFGIYKEKARTVPVFGLPGNPVSTMVTFVQFVRPALYRMLGRTDDATVRLKATLEHEFRKKDGKRHFTRGIVRNENGSLIVRTTGTQSSGALTSMAKANCFVVVPEEKMEIRAGEEVEIELF